MVEVLLIEISRTMVEKSFQLLIISTVCSGLSFIYLVFNQKVA